ncbi:hypothetical protein HNR76_000466 [Pseudoxanthomonas broegbernensis]|nr:hypothetical protein [Pseudoxanthomonas broegbernensis]
MPGAASGDDVPIDGRCFAYVFLCRGEDRCKIGFSRDPLARIGALHPRGPPPAALRARLVRARLIAVP